jgi:hypothetical protein
MILTCSEISAQIELRLAGQLSATALAAWALDTFYAIEQAALTVAEADATAVAEVLDALMFADDARFALDDTEMQRLIARLQSP